jgi:hypothetical protein
MDRKTMLVQAETKRPTVTKDLKKLEEEAVEGMALKMMSETKGWKILLERFITPRSSLSRFLQTKTTQERHEVHGSLNELNELMNFLDRHIKDGKTASEQIESIRKGGVK